jgi:hypothetical protein
MNKVKVSKYFEALGKSVIEIIPVNQLAEFERAGWAIVPSAPIEQLPELKGIKSKDK